jgi:queuine/archaeosine tRNA-ribosyltransferase
MSDKYMVEFRANFVEDAVWGSLDDIEYDRYDKAVDIMRAEQEKDAENENTVWEYRVIVVDSGSVDDSVLVKVKKSAEEKIRAIVSGGNRSHMLDLTFVEMQEILVALDAKLRMEEQLREMTEAKKRTIRMYGDLIKASDDPTRIARLDGKMLAYTRVTEQLEAIRNGEDWTA